VARVVVLRKRRLRQKMADEGRLPPKASRRKGDVAGKVFGGAMIALAVATVWAEMRYGVKLMTPRNMVAGGAVLFVVVFVFITVRDRRNRDPAVAEALRLEKQGDVDGAVERLRAAVAEAPTAERAGALGALLYRRERWGEAADAFGEAGRLDPQGPVYPVLQAMALYKGGHNEEALGAARAARAAAPHEAAYAAAEALALAGLGRADEAAEQLRQSDELAVVAERDQRVDWATRLSLGVACREALKAAGSGRAFPVIPEAPRAGADMNPAT
jgi:tetratricopeptide (TPR) repeat protein